MLRLSRSTFTATWMSKLSVSTIAQPRIIRSPMRIDSCLAVSQVAWKRLTYAELDRQGGRNDRRTVLRWQFWNAARDAGSGSLRLSLFCFHTRV